MDAGYETDDASALAKSLLTPDPNDLFLPTQFEFILIVVICALQVYFLEYFISGSRTALSPFLAFIAIGPAMGLAIAGVIGAMIGAIVQNSIIYVVFKVLIVRSFIEKG